MRTFPTSRGPFSERPHYKPEEIERICSSELKQVNCLPQQPEPIRIDRFIEKRFGIIPEYEDLGENVLGYTRFGSKGAVAVVVSRSLDEEGTIVAQRRVRTTLAHEAGHILLQGHLFAVATPSASLFGSTADVSSTKILCREEGPDPRSGYGYDGKWWEFQANRAIGALLLPGHLVGACLASLLTVRGSLGLKILEIDRRPEAERALVESFDVNPVVARLRLAEIWPSSRESQLSL